MKRYMSLLALVMTIFSTAVWAADPQPSSAVGMVAQLPAFLSQLNRTRGSALTEVEKKSVTEVITKSSQTANDIHSKFLDGVSKASGIDKATISRMYAPSTTRSVATADLTGAIEKSLGKKLGLIEKTAVSSANSLRNKSLDELKSSLGNEVAGKLGMQPAQVMMLMPLLGF